MADRRVSIRDVARAAGVSPTTVSLVLNRSRIPATSTREKVLAVVKELSYEPDQMFRQAVQQRRTGHSAARLMTQTIGFLSAETILESAQQQDGYYSRVAAGIHRALERQQYHLMWKTQQADTLELPVMVTEGRVDGLLIEGEFPPLLRDLLAKRLPVAFIDRTYPELPANSVMPHIEQAVQEILAYLWDLGHRDIITFQHAGSSPQVQVYLRGFHGFFAEKTHAVAHAEACRPRAIAPETHAQVMAEYAREIAALRPRPTALVSWDVYACSLLVEFQRLGLRVPQDISLVGMDDWIGARLATPQLTTYRFPMEELGRSATELLIEQIKDRSRPVRHLVVNGQIVERASCAQPTT